MCSTYGKSVDRLSTTFGKASGSTQTFKTKSSYIQAKRVLILSSYKYCTQTLNNFLSLFLSVIRQFYTIYTALIIRTTYKELNLL